MTESPRVAVVGTGRMGGAMVGTLRRAGFPVTAYNRTRDRAERVAKESGATVADSPREAAEGADVVVCSLADDAAVRDAYGGGSGLAAGLREGAVVLETSTIDPETVRGVRPLVEDRGAALLDTPVSGSVPLVERGELTVMAGGSPEALDRARPVLEALAARILHVGDLGAGATMKLAVNAVVHALNLALAEALVLAERAGVERAVAYEVFAGSVAGGPFVQYKRAAFEQPEETPVAFSIELMAKDLDLIIGLAERSGSRMDQASVNRAVAADAIDAGFAARDMSAMASFLRGKD